MKTTRQSKAKTQLCKANAILLSLAPNITAEDKKAAQAEARNGATISRYTIADCIKGAAKDIDVALDLIKFFKRRIAAREKQLAAAA